MPEVHEARAIRDLSAAPRPEPCGIARADASTGDDYRGRTGQRGERAGYRFLRDAIEKPIIV